MKKLLVIILTLALVSPALAVPTVKVGFRAYSSAASKTCAVFGMEKSLATNTDGIPVQGFTPDPTFSRTLTLGTKGFANYSTTKVRAIKFSCRQTSTNTTEAVKVFLNGVETHFLTVDSDIFVIK